MTDRKVVLLRGLPGSGKSTWRMATYPGAPHVDVTDHFPCRLPNESEWPGVHRAVDAELERLLDEGHPVVSVERCHLTRHPVEMASRLAAWYGYSVEVVTLDTPPALCKEHRAGMDLDWPWMLRVWCVEPDWLDPSTHRVVRRP